MSKVIFTSEQVEDIIFLYQNLNIGSNKIGKQFDVSKNVILRVLRENGIPIKQDNHKYYADYKKFEKIDSSEKAYWLGFIAADGCVYVRKENASVIISIHRKDREHLEKFQDFMKSNVPIKDFENTKGFSEEHHSPMSKITFNSISMAQDFIKLGCASKKIFNFKAS